MALRSRTILKAYFKKYATPTPAQYADLIDSFLHLSEDILNEYKDKLSVENIAGLQDKIDEVKKAIPTELDVEKITGLNQLIEEVKKDLLEAINNATAAKYVRQVVSFDEINEPKDGDIVQFIGTTNESAEQFRGFFYEYGEVPAKFTGETLCVLVYNGTGIYKNFSGEPNAKHPTTGAECYVFFPAYSETFDALGTNIFTDFQGNYLSIDCAGEFHEPKTATICDEYGDFDEGAKVEKGIFSNLNAAKTYASRGCFEIAAEAKGWQVIRVSPVL